MNATQIRQRLDSILVYMQPYWEFVNCHMVNYITDKHWERYIPQELRNEVTNLQAVKECIELLIWQRANEAKSKYFNINKFLEQTQQHTLEHFADIISSTEQISGVCEKPDISIKEFMSEKKRHEVEITAAFVTNLIDKFRKDTQFEQDIYIVDAGDGKGYLSSRLALQYGHKVLGIDANAMNTEQALERGRKLNRAWSGLTARAALENQGITPPRRGKKSQLNVSSNQEDAKKTQQIDNYRTTAQFITTDLNLRNILMDFFPEKTPAVCLTGLHTCGNLAATCLKVFHAQNDCKILCNIGCCYHLLKELHAGPEFFGNKAIMSQQTECGFPMSKYLQERRFCLGRNARMLAAQSIERTRTAKELPNISLYYRALLEVIICEHNPELKDTIQVGKIRKFNNFEEYLRLCIRKVDDQDLLKSMHSSDLENYLTKFENDRYYLDLFYLLRMSFAPILESIILLDRLLYLKELGYEQSYLVSLFDAVISPRHFAIVALRKLSANEIC